MFCGQETYGWGGNEFPDPDITTPADIIGLYNAFVNRNNNGEPIKRPGYYHKKLDNGQYKVGKANISLGLNE